MRNYDERRRDWSGKATIGRYDLVQTDEDIKEINSFILEENAVEAMCQEYTWAEKNHPNWPDDIVHATAIMIEEAGESMQAALDLHYGKEVSSDHLYKELAQTAAMCLRTMVGLQERKGKVV